MNQKDTYELIERIGTEPSVFIMGQKALASYTGNDPFLFYVSQKYKHTIPDYQSLWSLSDRLDERLCKDLNQISGTIMPQWWLRKILSMRWNLVYSSGIDAIIAHGVGPNISIVSIPKDKTAFKREYISKQHLHVNYLFGAVDADDPKDLPVPTLSKKDLSGWSRSIREKLRWIYSDIIRHYGILVIDGWDPENDLLSEDTLIGVLQDLPYKSVYIFGATADIQNSISENNLDETVVCERSRFAQVLSNSGFFDNLDEVAINSEEPKEDSKTISLGNGANAFTISIPTAAVTALDPQITLFHDELIRVSKPDEEDTRVALAKFLQQPDVPQWQYYTDAYKFYVERNVDRVLLDCVVDELQRKSSLKAKPIVVKGTSNSGKTSALIYLAIQIQKKRLAPVLFIRGAMNQAGFEKELSLFIKKYLYKENNRKVLIVWDGSQNLDAAERYRHLSNTLRECNATVVGSCYSKMNATSSDGRHAQYHLVDIPLTMTQSEFKKYCQMLEKYADSVLYRSFVQFAPSYDPRNGPWANQSLFYVLNKLSAFSYDSEWRAVGRMVNDRFNRELLINDTQIEQAISDLQKVDTAIVKNGIAAAWQMQLERVRNQMLLDNPDHLEKLDSCKDMIKKANEILAVSSQFQVPLPLSLLLRTACGSVFSKESAMIKELLEVDSLVLLTSDKDGFVMVQFRHPAEAEAYISKNYPDKNAALEMEVDTLLDLIKTCSWTQPEESYQMIRLVRQFGPNSTGKYSENPQRGQYRSYVDFFETIAETLKTSTGGDYPEATVVYAHLLRELHAVNLSFGLVEDQNLLQNAANELSEALESTTLPDAQRRRLLGEYCANLAASMCDKYTPGVVQRTDFRVFRKYFYQALSLRDVDDSSGFSDNFTLDNWLNALNTLLSSYDSEDAAMQDDFFMDCIADTLANIDTLLDLSQDQQEMTNLLQKINDVYTLCSEDRLIQLEQQVTDKKKDTLLYLRARKCWMHEYGPSGNLFFIPDDLQIDFACKISDLRSALVSAAKKAISILEPNHTTLTQSQSGRCIYMLLRAKWIVLTKGHMPLEEKQHPPLTADDWETIHQLCDEYLLYCSGTNTRPAPAALLLEGIWQWQFGQFEIASNRFHECRSRIRSDGFFYERIGLCVLGSTRLREFIVDISQNQNGNFRAAIRAERDRQSNSTASPNVVGRKSIFISDLVLNRLFDSAVPTPTNNLSKPVVIWFNASGACLGLPQKGDIEDE